MERLCRQNVKFSDKRASLHSIPFRWKSAKNTPILNSSINLLKIRSFVVLSNEQNFIDTWEIAKSWDTGKNCWPTCLKLFNLEFCKWEKRGFGCFCFVLFSSIKPRGRKDFLRVLKIPGIKYVEVLVSRAYHGCTSYEVLKNCCFQNQRCFCIQDAGRSQIPAAQLARDATASGTHSNSAPAHLRLLGAPPQLTFEPSNA